MDPKKIKNSFILTFADDAQPGEPLTLKKASIRKLGETPSVVSKLVAAFGAQLGEPFLLDGAIYLPIAPSDNALSATAPDLMRIMRLTCRQLADNAEGKAVPLRVAVDHPNCIESLRSIAHARERAEFHVALKVENDIERFDGLTHKSVI